MVPADSPCQPPAPPHSSPPLPKPEHSCCCESQDMAFSLGIWLPKSGLAGGSFRGSRHGAQLAPEETEVCRQDEQPRPRCADTQSPVCSERDSIQTRWLAAGHSALFSPVNKSRWQYGVAQTRQRLEVPSPTSAVQMLTDTPATSWGRAQRAAVLPRGRALPADI